MKMKEENKVNVYDKMRDLGITLPEAPAKGGIYSPCKQFAENLYYVSGCGPSIGGEKIAGKLGKEFDIADGQTYARACMLNVLAVLKREIGDLNRVKNIAKLLVFVASADDFYMQPQVANGASQLLVDLFGADDAPARSAIGVNVLPGNIPVEIEALFEVE